jgi:3-phosphoinositide dependent protein kinase-1
LCSFVYMFQNALTFFIVTPCYSNGSLDEMISSSSFKEEHVKFFFAGMALALNQLHHLKFVHRDLKPQNFMIDMNFKIKLIDFGLGKFLPDVRKGSRTVAGTPNYFSVEMAKIHRGYATMQYSFATDWSSLGLTLFEMMTKTQAYTRNWKTSLQELLEESSLRVSNLN